LLSTLPGWIAAVLLPAALLPLSAALLPRAGFLLTATIALALSGMLTAAITFTLGVIGVPLTALTILLPYAAITAIGTTAARSRLRPCLSLTLPRRGWPLLIVGISAGAALINALVWPFNTDDALGIYQPQAQAIYQTGAILPLTGADSLYRAYPMLIQYHYAAIYFAAGWEHEYAAKLLPTLLGLSNLVIVAALARLLTGERAGWIAALVLALTPAFARWASSGYVDLPMAAYYGLAALFALRWLRGGSDHEAALSALWIAGAAWTKNAALIGGALWGVTLIAIALYRNGSGGLRRLIVPFALAAGLTAPFYIRNLIGAGFIAPATAWTEQAERTLTNLLIFVTLPDNYALSGLALLVGIGWGLAQLLRSSAQRGGVLLLLTWTLPYFVAWWLFVSYDPRFLLLFVPLLAALAGSALDRIARDHLTAPARLRRLLFVVGLITALVIAWRSVDYKDELLREPFMSHAQRLELVGR